MTMLLVGLDQFPDVESHAMKLDKDLDDAIRLCIESKQISLELFSRPSFGLIVLYKSMP